MTNAVPFQNKLKILIGAHIGLPVGGISKNYESLLASNLMSKADVYFVETSKGDLSFAARGGYKIINILNACKNITRYVKTLVEVKPDIVHLGTASGLSLLKHGAMAFIARLLRYKVIVQFHFSFSKLQSQNILSNLAVWMIGYCNGAIIISSEWLQLQKIFPKMRIKFIPNAIDTRIYSDIERPRNTQIDSGVQLLYLGHLGKDKGIYDLLQAIRVLKEKTLMKFMLDLYGESLEIGAFENIRTVIEKSGLSDVVRIHNPVYNEDKKKVLALSDIFILASHHEGMPISIIEAMAAGLPIIASMVGGITDQIIDEETGYLVQPNNPNELCQALQKLIEDRKLRIRMGSAGRERAVNNFDNNNRVESLLLFYELIRSKPN